jgi:hypothetical protein
LGQAPWVVSNAMNFLNWNPVQDAGDEAEALDLGWPPSRKITNPKSKGKLKQAQVKSVWPAEHNTELRRSG